MSKDPDVMHPLRDEAFRLAEDLAAHILDTSNSYRALSEQDEFPGRDRMRLVILLVMFEEVGKLMSLVKECEKAAKADYVNVRIEDYHDHCRNGRKAAAQILEELRTVEQASMALGRKDIKISEEPAFLREDFCSLQERLLYLDADTKKRSLTFIPPGDLMDRYAEIIERNTLAAAEYIHDLGRALGLWLQLGRKAKRVEGKPRSVRYT
jgi:hypothetical protein